jgi:Uma2 family endonuclease
MATVQEVKRRRVKQRPAPPSEARTISLVTDYQVLTVPADALSLAGFRAWATADGFPEQIRVTFIEGEIFLDMSNEEPETHIAVKTEVTRVLAALCREAKLGKFYADGLLVTNEDAQVSNNPDAVFFSRETLASGRVQLVPRREGERRYRELMGTPDWILEVVSDSSVNKDRVKLRAAYHRAGIPEYWLVDARGEEIRFQILRRRKERYTTTPEKDGWQHSQVFGRSFSLERRRDELDLWEYTLHVRDA